MRAPEYTACPELSKVLTGLHARRMVVGHTTQRSGEVAVRCGGQLLGIDLGISRYYGQHIGFVEMIDGDARAVYPTGLVDIIDP